jgi:hypothetical protein
MKEYIAALLPRLQQFSKSLNDTALLAEHPWVFLDGDGRRITHIFRRGGELLVALARIRGFIYVVRGDGFNYFNERYPAISLHIGPRDTNQLRQNNGSTPNLVGFHIFTA